MFLLKVIKTDNLTQPAGELMLLQLLSYELSCYGHEIELAFGIVPYAPAPALER